MGLGDAVKSLKGAIGDLTSLEVQTFTGTLESLVDNVTGDKPATGGSVIDWKKVVASARTKTKGKVRLAMATKVNFDGDTSLYIGEEEIPSYILQAHEKAVENGRQVRKDIIEFMGDTLRNAL